MRKILQVIKVAGTSHEVVMRAVEMENFGDFEDCLQDRCAETVKARYIVTNNVVDYKESVIEAITPADFCRIAEK